jgi:hypothetical protein
MSLDHERATVFVSGYGRTWESGDVEGFVALFSPATQGQDVTQRATFT